MNETLNYLTMLARFPFAARQFLKQTLTEEEAKRILQERMAQRDENFVYQVERCVYQYPSSPYLPLFKMAQCEASDLRALVKASGVEGALRALRAAGVYVTFEEFKGRTPMIRNGKELETNAQAFDNPFTKASLMAESGGSTGKATRVTQDFTQLAARAPHQLVTTVAHHLREAPTVVWRGIIPDNTINTILQRASYGDLPAYWYSHLGWRDSKHWFKYSLATCYQVMALWSVGVRIPFPRHVPVERVEIVLQTIVELIKIHKQCRLSTTVGRALRVCLAAEQAGIRLDGLVLGIGGEPITSTKVQVMERVGAKYYANYSLTEAGTLGNACNRPLDFDDVHLFRDAFALITHPYRVDGFDITVPAFNLTTLLPSAPKILLNLQMDDYGIVEERACGCEFETYGFTTHVREIRSYRKLTGEGVTLVGSEMLKLLEVDLPARFGGTLLDYQWAEQENESGLTKVVLYIHPRLDIPDEQRVIDFVLAALARSSAMADAARAVWQDTNALKIIRREPQLTGRGKVSPLHLSTEFNLKG